MLLPPRGGGKVGRRRDFFKSPPHRGGLLRFHDGRFRPLR